MEIKMCNRRAVEVRSVFWRLSRAMQNEQLALVRFLTTGKEREVPADELYEVAEPENLPKVVLRVGSPMTKLKGQEMLWGPTLREQVRGAADWLTV